MSIVIRSHRHAVRFGASLSVLALLGPAFGANAKEAVPLDAKAGTEISEVLVLGRGAQRLRIAGSSHVVNEADLERSRVLTVNEALRQVPGVYARDEEGLGLRPNIGIRGLAPTRSTKILQLEDGLPLSYAPYTDNASYSTPPFRRFVRIETLKGASQIRFGPNTVGGVINFITPSAPETFGGDLFMAGGGRGYRELDLKIGGPVLGELAAIGHANRTRSNGVRDNTALETQDLWGKLEGRLSAHHAIALRVGHATEDSQVTYSGLTAAEYAADPRQNPFANDHFKIKRATAAITHGWTLSESLNLKTSAYSLWFDRDWWRQSSNSGQRPNDASDPACGGMANLNTTCGNEGRLREYNTYGLDTRLTWTGALAGAQAVIEAGARHQWERQNRLQLNGDRPTARTAGTSVNGGVRENNLRYGEASAGFVSASLTWDRLTVNPGLRVEQIDYRRVNRLNGTTGETDLSEWIPGLGFAWAVKPGAYLYGGVHRGFAPPRAEDIVSGTGGVVDIDAEESVNSEIGYRSAVRPGLFVDINAFRMDFDNQVIPASVAGGVGATLTNGGKTRHQGVELSLKGSLREMGMIRGDDVFFRSALTWLPDAAFVGTRRSSVSGFGGVSVSGNRLPYAPRWLASAAIGYSFGVHTDVQLEVQHTGKMFTDDLNTVTQTADGQRGLIKSATVWNASLNTRPFGDRTTLFLAVKNIGDKLYIADRSRGILPGAPRLAQIGLSQRF
ncbi:MAG: TonB-dependent receptor family protein [Caulobacter sp.]